ncbi:MAG: redoxin domain-containing protein [Elusimicrobia bacterium]|nr:redoxin domain-containing protein [Elusimicrobiota bacterium]
MTAIALAALLASSSAAAPGPKAPELKIAKVFNAPVSEVKSLASLKGKVVFVEFWATWCAPCVAGVPRTNRLIDALKGEPVVFLSVTDEPADQIAAFLKTHEFKSWVGVDEARSSLKAYKVRGRPDGYLIGKDGTLLARIFPDSLKESDVRDAIAGRFTPVPVKFGGGEGPALPAASGRTLFEVLISSAAGEPSMSRGDGMLEGGGLPFSALLAWIWDVEDEQVVVDAPAPDSFNFRLRTPPEGFERGRELLKQAVQAAFAVRVEPMIKETDVFLLTLSTEAGAPRPQLGDPALKPGIMASGGGRLLGRSTMARFAKALWMGSPKPVIDATGLDGLYFLDLEWKRRDDAARDRALAAHGLKLVPGRREVEFLRVLPAKKD